MSATTPHVRSGDVGYGHIKFTEGRNDQGQIITSSTPSHSLAAAALYAKGRAALYAPAVSTLLPSHKVVILPSPVTTNFHGFLEFCEVVARSRVRAMQTRDLGNA